MGLVSLEELREMAKEQFSFDLELENRGGESSPPVPNEVQSSGDRVESISPAIKKSIDKQAKKCADKDREIEALLKKMLYGTVEISDIFDLVNLELDWRIINNESPKFQKSKQAWSRLQDKVNLLK